MTNRPKWIVSPSGGLSINVADFFSQPLILRDIKKLMASDLYKSLRVGVGNAVK